MVVENRAGAGGTIGTASVAKAAPDGYTLLLGNVSTLATAPSLYTKLTYDPLKDFTPLTLVGRSPLVFAVNPGVKANNLKELIAAATAQPGALDYGSSGAGSITHLTGELLNVNTKGAMVHVPYKGSAPVVMAMVSGELDMGVTQVAEMLQQYRAKQVRALAITGNQRLSAIPEVPTAAEAGVTGLDATTVRGRRAPGPAAAGHRQAAAHAREGAGQSRHEKALRRGRADPGILDARGAEGPDAQRHPEVGRGSQARRRETRLKLTHPQHCACLYLGRTEPALPVRSGA